VNRLRTADYLRFAVVFFGVLVVLRFLWLTKSIVLMAILATLFGVTLSRGVDLLERLHIRRAFGTLIILLVVLGTVVAIGFAIAPSLSEQMDELKTKMPSAVEQLEKKLRRTPIANAALDAVPPVPAAKPAVGKQAPSALSGHMQSFGKMLFPFVSNSIEAIAGLVIVLFLAAYFAIDPGLYRRGIVALVPPKRRGRASELFDHLSALLRQWFLARVMAMVAVGVITGVALALLKIPAAGALGLIAGLLEFVPFVGPIASAVPAIAMALIVSPTKAIYVIILFTVIQQLEGNLITPMLMKNRLDVPPAVTILAVAALGVVFGVLGMLVAEPLSAVVILAVRELYVDRMEEAQVS
jgi:predicted PurR-regulated permease PerM